MRGCCTALWRSLPRAADEGPFQSAAGDDRLFPRAQVRPLGFSDSALAHPEAGDDPAALVEVLVYRAEVAMVHDPVTAADMPLRRASPAPGRFFCFVSFWRSSAADRSRRPLTGSGCLPCPAGAPRAVDRGHPLPPSRHLPTVGECRGTSCNEAPLPADSASVDAIDVLSIIRLPPSTYRCLCMKVARPRGFDPEDSLAIAP